MATAPIAAPGLDPHACACSAVVMQLPTGETPGDIAHFDGATHVSLPKKAETDQPSWLSLAQLISHAHSIRLEHGKQRWIRAGNIVLSPTDIQELHDFYRHHGTRK